MNSLHIATPLCVQRKYAHLNTYLSVCIYAHINDISGFCWYGDSVGIPTGFSVGMGWVWGLKSNPHGSPVSGRETD